MQFKKYPGRLFRHLLSAPFIYMMVVPLVILDIFLEVYHRICFPLYGIAYVVRASYIKIDRHRLKYLTWMEKINCAYCGYANGLMAYGVEIAGRTEAYWCGIKHQQDAQFNAPARHSSFMEYGNQDQYENIHEPR